MTHLALWKGNNNFHPGGDGTVFRVSEELEDILLLGIVQIRIPDRTVPFECRRISSATEPRRQGEESSPPEKNEYMDHYYNK